MASRYIEALAFLTDPNRVRFYTNAERSKPACPTCGAEGEDPCRALKSRCRLTNWHPARTREPVPRSAEELDAIIEKLARRYARAYDPMESYGPRRYPR